jgi:hypothetical protein
MKDFDIIEIRLEPHKGATLSACINEALQIAVTEQRNVSFDFNWHTFRVNLRDITALLYNQHPGGATV